MLVPIVPAPTDEVFPKIEEVWRLVARFAIGGDSLYDPEPYVLDNPMKNSERSKGRVNGDVIKSQYLELIKGSLSSANGIESFDVIPICRPFLLLLLLVVDVWLTPTAGIAVVVVVSGEPAIGAVDGAPSTDVVVRFLR